MYNKVYRVSAEIAKYEERICKGKSKSAVSLGIIVLSLFNFCICHALYLRYLVVILITYSDFSLPYGLNILYSPRTPLPGHLNVIKVPVFSMQESFPPHRPDWHWSSPASCSTGNVGSFHRSKAAGA